MVRRSYKVSPRNDVFEEQSCGGGFGVAGYVLAYDHVGRVFRLVGRLVGARNGDLLQRLYHAGISIVRQLQFHRLLPTGVDTDGWLNSRTIALNLIFWVRLYHVCYYTVSMKAVLGPWGPMLIEIATSSWQLVHERVACRALLCECL